MSIATIHDIGAAARPPRPLRPAVDGPASLTITVRIDLPGGQLPAGAIDLVDSLRSLAQPAAGREPPRSREPVPGREPTPGLSADGPASPGSGGTAGAVGVRVFLASRMVLRDGAPVSLTRREFDLLAFLCANPRRVFDRAALLRQVWGYGMVGGERTVDVHVRRLRAKLGESAPLIATVRGVGYRLDDAARVAVVDAA